MTTTSPYSSGPASRGSERRKAALPRVFHGVCVRFLRTRTGLMPMVWDILTHDVRSWQQGRTRSTPTRPYYISESLLIGGVWFFHILLPQSVKNTNWRDPLIVITNGFQLNLYGHRGIWCQFLLISVRTDAWRASALNATRCIPDYDYATLSYSEYFN